MCVCVNENEEGRERGRERLGARMLEKVYIRTKFLFSTVGGQ